MSGVAGSPIFLGLALALIVVELAWRLRSGQGYSWPTARTTLGLAAGNFAIGPLKVVVVGAAYAAVWALTPLRLPLDDWRTWAAAFLLVEFAYYWFHRASHRVRWLWATHAVHHSAEQMTLLSSMRLGWTSLFSLGWTFYLPIVAIGFHPRLVLGLVALNLRYQFFLHTEAVGKLGPLEWIFNTPAHHRAHHASNDCYVDRNYGGVLILFDQLFGTLAPRLDEPIRYGLAHRKDETNPIRLALREWGILFADMRKAGSLKAAVRKALSPP
ncbi:sterol desaturase/sphingolipid hydroxylase (fatty acid hydroxylase superfamily) [Sphingomonas zeicaulis]|uniref:sterol desaturase family protein n=1 Tax=Sphingomonas zeicaulis TaxID=1632740 RepID=UPI003D2610D1